MTLQSSAIPFAKSVAGSPRRAWALSATEALPSYEEISSIEELRDPKLVLSRLMDRNWSFTDDNTQYLSHDIHPYPAKFIPQLPGTLISLLSVRGELVLDPFGGSGTTALEAVRLGRRAVSIDANPIATLIGRAKTTRLSVADRDELQGLTTTLRSRLASMPTDPRRLRDEVSGFIPAIPNLDKWFPITSQGELALVRACIHKLRSESARDLCLLALSKVVLRASFQDSETRYASKPRDISAGETLEKFLESLASVMRKIAETASEIRYGQARFLTMDARTISRDSIPDNSVELIVTSPPYGNAMDYHLYHRFRLFWIGVDPGHLAKIEIGSHLRHQKEGTGFSHYVAELRPCVCEMQRALKPGRYAILIVGDAVYEGKSYCGMSAIKGLASESGLEYVGAYQRSIHRTKRSFIVAGRRAEEESIILLRKPESACNIELLPPGYRMWPYEEGMRLREAVQLLGNASRGRAGMLRVTCDCYVAGNARRLAFSHLIKFPEHVEQTWQKVLENGYSDEKTTRKDPKYVTHGLHTYKGKFYPQLAKSLLNISGLREGATVLDPFCGSGTTLLESHLNGFASYGCDMHPLAAKISVAKTGVLQLEPSLVSEAASLLIGSLTTRNRGIPASTDHLPQAARDEIGNWFPKPVVHKINWILDRIRSVSTGVLQDFLEVVLSDILREVSHQDPGDLRIRRRKTPLRDADAIGLYVERLTAQLNRLERFWVNRCYCPYRFYPSHVTCGDSRDARTFSSLGIDRNSIDLILTSPPYATALPYIDTDRLSLLVLFGLSSGLRRPLEESLSGSREIRLSDRKRLEDELLTDAKVDLPSDIAEFLRDLYRTNSSVDVGFRRRNLPALLVRFFRDMRDVLVNCLRHLKPDAEAMIVVGDSYTMVNKERRLIPTTAFLEAIGRTIGFESMEQIEISVTTDNHKHIKNAITKNMVLRLRRPAHSQPK